MSTRRGSYIYPPYAHRSAEAAALADWPPSRPSGPEPGSYDMPPAPGPLNTLGDMPQLSNMEMTALVVGGVGFAAWWFMFRKPKRGRKR